MESNTNNVPTKTQYKKIIELNSWKEQVKTESSLRNNSDVSCQAEIKDAIQSIKLRMSQCKLAELYPPFLPKTVTRYRHQYFLPIKQKINDLLNRNRNEEFQSAMQILLSFVLNFDSQLFDDYLQQLREPYIRKIFTQNYSLNAIDFKTVQNDEKQRGYIQNLLNNASQWLIQIEKSQDLFQRIELYFDIQTPIIIQKAKKQGAQLNKNRAFRQKIYSFMRNLFSFTLRKSAKIIQSTFFSAMAPSAIILTLAIISGSATLPWQSVLNGKLLVTPIMALTVPFVLEGLASSIDKSELIKQLQEQSALLQQISQSIEKFNEQVQATILLCCKAKSQLEFDKQKLNLEKYVKVLSENLSNLPKFNQETMQEMRDRTEAYFKNYSQIQEGQWTIVIPTEQMSSYQQEKVQKSQPK